MAQLTVPPPSSTSSRRLTRQGALGQRWLEELKVNGKTLAHPDGLGRVIGDVVTRVGVDENAGDRSLAHHSVKDSMQSVCSTRTIRGRG